MTKKELKKLSRVELLEFLTRQTRKAERLEEENERLKVRLTEREQHLTATSNLAEAVLQMGLGVSKEQRAAAEEYLNGIRRIMEEEDSEEEAEESGEDEESEEEDEPPNMPTADELDWLLSQDRYLQRYLWSLKSTVYALITVAAVAVLIAVLVMPVMQIYGSSMNPTLWEGNFVVSLKGSQMQTGDIVAFYYNNKILVKRVIGQPGQWVDIAEDGTVYVDNVEIKEPYIEEKALGECDIELPYQVPESRIFVMGDNRDVSVDSRSKEIGCIAEEQIVGKIVFRVWPLNQFGTI